MKQILDGTKKFFSGPRLVIMLLIGAAMTIDHVFGMFSTTFSLAFAALAEDRDTPERDSVLFNFGVAAAKHCYAGGIAVKNASGYVQPGTTALGLICVGRFENQVDNSAGLDGALTALVRRGVFQWKNSADADLITIAEIGQACYIVDDQTVAKTNGGATRSLAGKIVDVDSSGVWVEAGMSWSLDGDLAAANNLSDVVSAATARTNLGFDAHTGVVTRRHKNIAGAAAYAVTTADGDSLIQTATDNAVVTLPDAAAGNKGMRVTVQNTGAAGAAKVSVSPHASDKIVGTIGAVTFSGVADKDAISTKLTAVQGDFITLESDGVDTWWVVGGVGVWASEA